MFFNPSYKKANHIYIRETLLAFCDDVSVLDREYMIPDDPVYVMQKVPTGYFYTRDRRDCDDFVRIFRGWLSKKGWGNLLAMECHIRFADGKRHALIAFLHKNKITFGEPQRGLLRHINDCEILKLIA